MLGGKKAQHTGDFFIFGNGKLWFYLGKINECTPKKGSISKGNFIFQPSIFRGYVSFRESINPSFPLIGASLQPYLSMRNEGSLI